jgi:hypothetical protein
VADISPYKLERAMAAVSRLKAELASQDSDMILASIESETSALELMDLVIEAVVADEALIEKAEARMRRITARANRHRLILKAMMEQIAERVERPLATLSVSHRTEVVEVPTNEELPSMFFRTTPDKTMIAKTLRGGGKLPGYELREKPDLTMILRSA